MMYSSGGEYMKFSMVVAGNNVPDNFKICMWAPKRPSCSFWGRNSNNASTEEESKLILLYISFIHFLISNFQLPKGINN